ncbi:MAG: hypothetical protein K6C09_06435 [Oscillospiraceae bacterium]|nr:hypothetical protein [Oscillospiraceae bacterium]
MRNYESITGKRIAAGILGLFLVLTLLLSGLYMAAEAGHECAGEECDICAAIRWCGLVLRSSGASAAPILTAYVLSVTAAVAAGSVLFRLLGQTTPVGNRVRMNN